MCVEPLHFFSQLIVSCSIFQRLRARVRTPVDPAPTRIPLARSPTKGSRGGPALAKSYFKCTRVGAVSTGGDGMGWLYAYIVADAREQHFHRACMLVSVGCMKFSEKLSIMVLIELPYVQ